MIELVGKFHPLLVHLPIGFLLLLGLLEWLALRPGGKDLAAANRLILLLSMPVTLASVLCGWLLATTGAYDPTALFWHRWLGTGLAVAVGVLWIVRQRGWMKLYRRSLVLTLGLLTVASHHGGTLTHGRDFLSWPKSRATTPPATANLLTQPVYDAIIQPLFNDYCVSCHGSTKAKGGLRLDTAAHTQAGGDSGKLFAADDYRLGLLVQRLELPLEDEDHMPPEGKPQFSPAQLKLILWWAAQGAPTDQTTLGELQPAAEILAALATSSRPAK